MLITKEKLPAILFFVVSEIMYSFELTYLKLPNSIYTPLLLFTFILSIFSIFLSEWTLGKIVRTLLLLIIAVCVYISSTETLFVTLILSAIVMNNISYKDASKVMFYTRLVMTSLIVFLSLIGVIPLNKLNVSKGVFGSATGYGLGYIHPNNLAQALFVLCCLYLCMNFDKLKSKNLWCILIVDLITFEITKSKTACSILLIIVILIFLRDNKLVVNIIKKFSGVYVLTVGGLAVLIPMLYTYSTGTLQRLMYILNGYFNGRFINASNMFLSFPITWFGKIINLDYLQRIYGYNVVDNGYVFLLFDYGIIGFLLIAFLYLYAISKLTRKDFFIFVLVIVGFLSLALMENVIRAMFMNFTMIFWYEFIDHKKYVKEKAIEVK